MLTKNEVFDPNSKRLGTIGLQSVTWTFGKPRNKDRSCTLTLTRKIRWTKDPMRHKLSLRKSNKEREKRRPARRWPLQVSTQPHYYRPLIRFNLECQIQTTGFPWLAMEMGNKEKCEKTEEEEEEKEGKRKTKTHLYRVVIITR